MDKPLVGITTRTMLLSRQIVSDRIQAVAEDYVDALRWAGAVPVLVPSNLGGDGVRELAPRLAGVVLTGGPDVDPVHFGEEPLPGLGDIDPVRDEAEMALCRAAMEDDLPLLAICRGIQVLNVALGGKVIQDLEGAGIKGLLQHDVKTFRSGPGHSVTVRDNTRLRAIVGVDTLRVNSAHHQAVGEVAPGLSICAVAPDGVVEAVEHPRRRFLMGVEWHPERAYLHDSAQAAILKAFVEACA